MQWRQPLRPRTLQMRLTLLYSGLFVVSGALVLAIANVGARSSLVAVPGDPGRRLVLPTPQEWLLPPPEQTTDRLVVSSLVALAVMFVISIGLGWIVAGRALRPLRVMTATAREISATNLHRRLALDGPADEITELGATLDDLFARLEASFESQRRFVANASHELRTPLTAERAVLQVALADPDASTGTLREACEEALLLGAQQERLIAALLTLAGGEGGLERREPFDLAGVVREVVAARRDEAGRRGIEVELALAPAPIAGDPSLVGSLVANLVDNAVRHNVAEPDSARVEVRTATVGDRSVLTVANTGPLVPERDVEQLLLPFRRLGGDRLHHDGGHGLGLAIVVAIAHSHDAALTVGPRPSGGLDVEVSFASPG